MAETFGGCDPWGAIAGRVHSWRGVTAKQSILFFARRHGLRRFDIAMTAEDMCFAFAGTTRYASRPEALRPRYTYFPPSEIRGRRECRMRAAPAVSCANSAKKAAHEHTGQRRTSDIPCAMALRLITRSPRSGRARCHRRPSEALASSELDASIRGKSGPRVFTVRLSRARQCANISVHRNPSLVVTTADAPLSGTGWRKDIPLIWLLRKAKYF